ncbi:hypothetical protein [Streptomyces hydrogenans]|uniref:Uncharacterized protein n=1 Tax=Streptomyces hydrogenans TaxID=1873719 RepID=A0ABQ3PJE7_9ACTN|nr:hypothetical protein [Streptomyces hydrogenans]GHF94584.1 hypothetical protein GCM10018784_02810 [Streptomyces hydrogenans]GHI25155.1 hypothetical protein Shyd_65260 [Streptomyces hydrogenans]
MNDDVTRVFTEGGTVAHYLDFFHSPNHVETEALCGRTAYPGLWHGTGSQEEEERAADLRICTPCRAVLIHRRNGYVPQ